MERLGVALDVLGEGGGEEPLPNPRGRGRKRSSGAHETRQPGGGEVPNLGRKPGRRGGNGRGVGGARAKGGCLVSRGKAEGAKDGRGGKAKATNLRGGATQVADQVFRF